MAGVDPGRGSLRNKGRRLVIKPPANRRLVIVAQTFPLLSETFIVRKFLGLLDLGWDVHVVCAASNERDWRVFPELAGRPGIRRRVHLRPPASPRWKAFLFIAPVLIRAWLAGPAVMRRCFRAAARRHGRKAAFQVYRDAPFFHLKPGLIHFEFGAQAVESTHLKALGNTRLVASFRGYDINYSGMENDAHYHDLWQNVDAVHALGEDIWRKIVARGCPANKPHRLIPPAVDVTSYEPRADSVVVADGTAERPVKILSVGRLTWVKGYEFALQAMAELKHRGVRFEYRIIGAGEMFEALAFARHQLGLSEEVVFEGAQPQAGVRKALGEADVFVQASVSEGFCNAVIEAQAMKVPVVASDAGGLPENVADGVTGLVVERRNPMALADALESLARDPARRREMGCAGRRRVTEHFALKDQADRFHELYLECPAAGDAQ